MIPITVATIAGDEATVTTPRARELRVDGIDVEPAALGENRESMNPLRGDGSGSALAGVRYPVARFLFLLVT
jgi:hypothetical protein